jgi:hypothetical protein
VSTGPFTGGQRPTRPWLFGLRAGLRILVSTTSLIVLYYVAPMSFRGDPYPMLLLGLALLGLAVLITLQTRSIVRSAAPRLRAIESLAATVPLLLVIFASSYFALAEAVAGSFNQPLTKTDALYFSVTVFSTVGFGDIAAVTQSARVAVMIQMVVDLLVLGVGLRIITSAVQLGQQRQAASSGGTSAPDAGGDA